MKLDELLPPLPRGDVYSMKRDDQAKMEYWTERQVRADRLACAHAAAVAALDEAAQKCEQRSVKHWDVYKTGPSPLQADSRIEAASDEADECAAAIRRLRDQLTEEPKHD